MCVMGFWVFILAYWFDLGGLLLSFLVLHGLALSSTKAFLLLISGNQCMCLFLILALK